MMTKTQDLAIRDSCGCQLIADAAYETAGGKLVFKDIGVVMCPMHKAAPDLLAALCDLEQRDTIMSALSDITECVRCSGIGNALGEPIKHQLDCPYAAITKMKGEAYDGPPARS